jgi:DNA-binding LacI/PurR family transcriptional regulator
LFLQHDLCRKVCNFTAKIMLQSEVGEGHGMTDRRSIDPHDPIASANRRQRATAADVARIAGVSRVAVSRAFTPGASIAAETRAKVMEAAGSIGYRPNALARQLNRSAPELVAFVGGSRANYYYSEFIDRLLPALQDAGHRVLYVHVSDDRQLADALLDISEYPVACTVVATGSLDRSVLQQCRAFAPMIISGPNHDLPGIDAVGVDSAAGVRLAVDHLVSRGRRALACISGPEENTSGMQRARVFRDHLESCGFEPGVIMHTAYSVVGGEAAARALLAKGPRPDAIVCGNDVVAIGVLNVLRGEAGITVPDEIAVIGFDDIPPAAWPGIGLTTIVNPIDERIGHVRALIARRIAEPDAPPREIMLPPRLVVRSTT